MFQEDTTGSPAVQRSTSTAAQRHSVSPGNVRYSGASPEKARSKSNAMTKSVTAGMSFQERQNFYDYVKYNNLLRNYVEVNKENTFTPRIS